MLYFQKEASSNLSNVVKSFWSIDGLENSSIKREKIIPDGYPEMIFHLRNPYRSNIDGKWMLQSKNIIAGQIRNHFYLENTGTYSMFGIKFQPWVLRTLFDIDMHKLTDRVESIEGELYNLLCPVKNTALSNKTFEEKVKAIETCFLELLKVNRLTRNKGIIATQLILKKNGAISIQEVLDKADMSERSLERFFKNYIGLSPKFYCRVIRFAHIFNLVKTNDKNWSKVTYQAGFYDQSHFIKNFKEFTGEDPTSYGFSEKTMANFLLN